MKFALATVGLLLLLAGFWMIAHPESGAAAPAPSAAQGELRAPGQEIPPVVAGVALLSGGALLLILVFRRR